MHQHNVSTQDALSGAGRCIFRWICCYFASRVSLTAVTIQIPKQIHFQEVQIHISQSDIDILMFFRLWDLHRLLQYPPIQCNGLPLVTQYKQKQTWDLQTTTSSVFFPKKWTRSANHSHSTPGKLLPERRYPPLYHS